MTTAADLDIDNDDPDDNNDDDQEPGQQQEPDNSTVRRLRKQIKALEKKAKRADELEKALGERAQQDAFKDADLDKLSPAQRKAVLANIDGEISAETVRAAAAEVGFVDRDPADAEVDEIGRIAQASAGATHVATSSLTAETVAAWGIDRQQKFMKEHPTEWEALKRGEVVTGIAF